MPPFVPKAQLVAALHWGSAVSLALTSLAVMGSPGPVTVTLTAAGSAHGVRRALPYLGGVVAGTMTVLVAVATGVTAALLAVPGLRPFLIAASVVYIVVLAYRIATAPPLAALSPTAAAPSLASGLLLGVANPKAWVAIGAVFASTHLARATTTDAAAKATVLAAMIVLICSAWLLVGASLAPLLRDPRRGRVLNATLAGALLAATAYAVLD